MSLDFKRFAKEDWYGFAGAERFEDGSDPLIAAMKVDGFSATVIVDGTGIGIFWEQDETATEYRSWSAAVKGAALALLLKPDMGREELEARGFRVLRRLHLRFGDDGLERLP